MSLLDDVSIVVTPNGYKAGELYAVVPVPTEGSELVVNGDFATDSDWTKGTGVTISGGSLNFSGVLSSENTYQSSSIEIGKRYLVTFTISNYTSGGIRAIIGSSGFTDVRTSNGTFTTDVVASGNTTIYLQTQNGTSTYSIDNVSVKEYTSADMDVTRATAATRVDENGLVNYAEVLGGEEIDNGKFTTNLDSWSTSSWWVWNSLGAYHPSTSLHKPLYQQCCVIGKTYLITFDLNCVGSSLAKFSLGSSTGSTTQVIDINLESGSYSYFVTAAAEYIIFNRQNTAEYYVNNVSVKEAARDNVPRIDYTGGGCPHILAEPQRTNLITYSSDFSNAIWTKSGSSVTLNATTSPDGTINADKLVEDTSTGGHQIQSITSSSNSTIYTTSVFVKYAGREWIRFTDAQSSNRIHFNTLTGVFGTVSGTVIDYNKTALENGWYKLSLTTTSVATAYTPRIALAEADNDVSYTGDGVSGVYIYGCSLEEGSYATSYIPTSGSTVTRNQDTFTRDGIGSLINSTEGVLFVEMAALADDLSFRYISLSDGTSSDAIKLYYTISSNSITLQVRRGGSLEVLSTFAVSDITDFNKIAVKWKVNDFAMWIGGVEVATDTSGSVPIGMNRLAFDDGSGVGELFGKVKQLQVYNTALTDTQLAALTS